MPTTAEEQPIDRITTRRILRRGDVVAIADLHRRIYGREYGLNERFTETVEQDVAAAVAGGWPDRTGAVWLVEAEGPLLGALALTDEGDGVGRVRWFALDPVLRGRGLGRSLMAELLDEARAAGLHTLRLETINVLTVAARIYTGIGFRVVWERERKDWGPRVTYQGYEHTLA
jgi:ribosomal protein S18 acetylase RimI-like enzyme